MLDDDVHASSPKYLIQFLSLIYVPLNKVLFCIFTASEKVKFHSKWKMTYRWKQSRCRREHPGSCHPDQGLLHRKIFCNWRSEIVKHVLK
jgi:hypothetical protein